MLEIQVTCSMCGGTHPKYTDESHDIAAGRITDLVLETVLDNLRAEGWTVQVNGENIDTYCCQRCAK